MEIQKKRASLCRRESLVTPIKTVGVELDMPTIGCAKSRLIGSHREVGMKKGSHCRLMDDKEVIGRVLRTREGLKCMYISEGHRIILDEAVQIVLKCCRGYRLPEPTRRAHQLATKIRKQVL